MDIKIGERLIGLDHPTYFIADISANHDGDLERAKALIHQCAEAGADAAKFQNFRAPKIVSDYGFKALGKQLSHQEKWEKEWGKTVFEIYADASIPFEWTPILKEECDKASIHYFSSPYDYDAIDMLDPYVPAYKAGSGLMSWPQAIVRMASKGKPIIISSGACDISDVTRTMRMVQAVNDQIILMQCNTNYTAELENFKYINLNVLKTYHALWPEVVLGLSDHTPKHATVLGAVALGARAIEKHFTDDNQRVGPDHPFSMTPETWREMVDRTRELELALGATDKFVAGNEQETYIVQRRCLRAARDIKAGEAISEDMLEALRPATPGAVPPYQIDLVIGAKALADLPQGKDIRWTDIGE